MMNSFLQEPPPSNIVLNNYCLSPFVSLDCFVELGLICLRMSGMLPLLANRKFEKIHGDEDEDDGSDKHVNKTLRTQELVKKISEFPAKTGSSDLGYCNSGKTLKNNYNIF